MTQETLTFGHPGCDGDLYNLKIRILDCMKLQNH